MDGCGYRGQAPSYRFALVGAALAAMNSPAMNGRPESDRAAAHRFLKKVMIGGSIAQMRAGLKISRLA
ncbi:MAG: hypothetical protein QG662_494 [Pseudomonadota bacterium]|nr:hypothetical protein [Pseudomonadota bacterium]